MAHSVGGRGTVLVVAGHAPNGDEPGLQRKDDQVAGLDLVDEPVELTRPVSDRVRTFVGVGGGYGSLDVVAGAGLAEIPQTEPAREKNPLIECRPFPLSVLSCAHHPGPHGTLPVNPCRMIAWRDRITAPVNDRLNKATWICHAVGSQPSVPLRAHP